jgi:hypothetical protein
MSSAKPTYQTHRATERAIHRALLALCSNDHGGHVRRINGGIEKFRAGELRKMDELVSDFLDLSSDLLTGFHSQFDGLTRVLLENAQDRIAGLEIDFALRKQLRANKREGQDNNE